MSNYITNWRKVDTFQIDNIYFFKKDRILR